MKRPIATIIATFLLTMVALFATQTPAQAAWTDCTAQPEKMCYYQGYNGTGAMYYHTDDGSFSGACRNIGGIFNNTISSIKNNIYFTVYFFRAANCASSGPHVPGGKKVLPYTQDDLLNEAYFDNQFSSFRALCSGYC